MYKIFAFFDVAKLNSHVESQVKTLV